MSIPLTASTEAFTPACMAEIDEAPSFTFRHATVLDKSNFAITLTAENIKIHGQDTIRDKIISELRRLFQGEGLAQNITRLEAFWQADDEWAAALNEHRNQVIAILSEAQDGDKPELPPQPELDFPADEIPGIELMLALVNEHSEILNLMTSQNLRYRIMHPRILIRMLLVSTTLDVSLKRRNGLILPESCEEILEALMVSARALGADPNEAVSQLLSKAQMAFYLSGEEEKNSSSPRSDIMSPALSQTKQSDGPQTEAALKSSDLVTSGADTGSISSE